jgi:hypothetical protein
MCAAVAPEADMSGAAAAGRLHVLDQLLHAPAALFSQYDVNGM